MTYATNEISIKDGDPFECYEFVTPLGTFRYTTLPVNVTLGGNVYTPLQISRTTISITMIVDSIQTMDIKIPLDTEIADGYTGRILPEYLTVRVFRAHVGDDLSTEFATEWRGEATAYTVEGGTFVIKTQSILQAKVQGASGTVYYQIPCNHRVYDARCGLDPASFSYAATVTDIDGFKITVTDDGVADSGLALGSITNDRTGEVRSIYDNTANVIDVTYPFRDLLIGDEVTLTLGCDNKMGTCVSRFNNVAKFGGFRYIPLKNPFKPGEYVG